MNEYAKKSILEMARGGFLEVTDLEMTKAIANIMDPNTSATAKRKITVTIELKADDSRQNIGVSYTVKSALAPTNAVTTMLYVADEENVVEMVPQIPGPVRNCPEPNRKHPRRSNSLNLPDEETTPC